MEFLEKINSEIDKECAVDEISDDCRKCPGFQWCISLQRIIRGNLKLPLAIKYVEKILNHLPEVTNPIWEKINGNPKEYP